MYYDNISEQLNKIFKREKVIIMRKTWEAPVMEELVINATANGLAPSDDFDDVWVQIGGLWYRPGDGAVSEAK